MEKVRLGQSNVEVSALCYGTDLIGSRVDEASSHGLLDLFADRGGTFIDTGNFYASWYPGCVGGESESTIGRWMAARRNRNRMVISTKLGFDYPGSDGGLNAGEIERECEKSLARLQTDCIDVYYAHRDDFDTPLEETMEAFHRLLQAGKVRTLGASNLWIWRVAEANMLASLRGLTPYSVVEQRYTYFRPRHGADFGPQIWLSEDMKRYCAHHAMTPIAYSILLQGAYTRDDRPIPAQFAGPEADERMTALRAVAADARATPNQVIIAWMRQSNPPVLPIIGGSQREQVEENIAALSVTLSDDHMERLTHAGEPDIKKAWLR